MMPRPSRPFGESGPVLMFRESLRLSRSATIFLTALIPITSVLDVLLALSVAWLAVSGTSNVGGRILAPVAILVATIFVQTGVLRLVDGLRNEVVEQVSAAVEESAVRSAAAPPTVSHLQDPAYLQSLHAVMRNSLAPANLPWACLSFVAGVLGLTASCVVLLLSGGWLWLLAIAAVFPVVAGLYGQSALRTARNRALEAMRKEQSLHALILGDKSSAELLVMGATDFVAAEALKASRLASRLALRGAIANVSIAVSGWAVFGAILFIAISLTVAGTQGRSISIGAATLVVLLSTRLKNQLSDALAGFETVSEGGRLGHHLKLLLRVPLVDSLSFAPDQLRDEDTDIVLLNASLRYLGARTEAIQDISVTFKAGTIVGIVGLNGAGKSSLADLILGLASPTRGSVTWGSVPAVVAASMKGSRAGAFQDFVKFELTALESVTVGDLDQENDVERANYAADCSGAAAAVAKFAQGWEQKLGENLGGLSLSTGQWQQFAIARALMNPGPKLLVLDEPSSALDPNVESDLFSRLIEHARKSKRLGSVVVIVSHRLSSMREVDQIVVLREGKLVELGTHRELIGLDGEYARLFTMQANSYRLGNESGGGADLAGTR